MNIFLVPASRTNVERSIRNSIAFEEARAHLTARQAAALKDVLGGEKSFNCWAMTGRKRSVFNSLSVGDLVLLFVDGTGVFSYVAQVIYKLESKRLGRHLWEYKRNGDWELIYILGNINEINIRKSKVVTEFGYEPNFEVPGAQRVKESNLSTMLSRHGSVEQFLEWLAVDPWSYTYVPSAIEVERQHKSGGGFGNSEMNREVEKAAISYVTRWYEAQGWEVVSVESEKVGYDLRCTRNTQEEHVEVKGVRGAAEGAIITAAEERYARASRKSVIFIVTSALSDPQPHRYTGSEFIKKFNLEVLQYRASLKV